MIFFCKTYLLKLCVIIPVHILHVLNCIIMEIFIMFISKAIINTKNYENKHYELLV